MDDPEFQIEEDLIDIEFFRGGGNKLSEREREVLGDLNGFRVLVSPEGSGDEVLSLIRMGARVTVYGGPLTSQPIKDAADALGYDVRVATGALGEMASAEIAGEQFDVVYSPWGSLDGLPDLTGWATDVASFLGEGGSVVIYDEHPVSFMVGEQSGSLVVKTSYWGEFTDEDEDGEPDEPTEAPTVFGWALGELITALGDAGLATIRLEEFEESDRYMTALQVIENITDEQRGFLPSAFLLVAKKV